MQVPIEKLTKTYIKIRDKRKGLSEEFKKKDNKLVEQLNKISQALLAHCDEHGVTGAKTTEGQFYRTVKQRYWTSDWEQMYKFVLEHEAPELMEKRLNQTNMRQFLEENPDLLPKGLNVDSEYTISVRKP